jgi:probable phosphoglycerate mutase
MSCEQTVEERGNMKNFKTVLFFISVFLVQSFCISAFDLKKLANVHEFYFLRHGQTDHNIGKVKQTNDIAINEVGYKQALQAQRFIETLPIKTICFSPLLRAVQTKTIVNQFAKIPEYSVLNLREGKGRQFHELQQVKNKQRVKVSARLKRFLKQVWSGLQESVLRHKGPVLMVSHGGVYSALCRILNINTDLWALGNCGIVRFYKTTDGAWHVELVFDLHRGQQYDSNYQPATA